MTDRELMQDALDALNNFDKGNHGMRWQVPLIKALRARLAQPEPAECDGGQCGIGGHCKECPKTKPEPEAKKYTEAICPVCGYYCLGKGGVNCIDKPKLCGIDTAPPQREWVGLTGEDIEDCLEMSIQGTCRAIEAKLKEKNG